MIRSPRLLVALLASLASPAFAAGNQPCFPDWNYLATDAHGGPAAWSTLYAGCAPSSTNVQSPIAISGAKPGPTLKPIVFQNYTAVPLFAENTTRAFTFVPVYTGSKSTSPSPSIVVAGTTYYLQQVHFHTPPEHQLGASPPPGAEAHFVHVGDGPGHPVVVVAVFLNFVPDLPMPATLGTMTTASAALSACSIAAVPINFSSLPDLTTLLPANQNYFTYVGSLTTPPCTGGVTFYVMQNAINVPASAQYALAPLQAFDGSLTGIHNNNRPPQANPAPPTIYQSNFPVAAAKRARP